MKTFNLRVASTYITCTALLFMLSACGGSTEERKITVVQELPNLTFVEPLPNSATALLNRLEKAGAVVTNARCGRVYSGLNITLGNNTDLVLEISESQLPLVIAAGFSQIVELDDKQKAEFDKLVALGFIFYDSGGIKFSTEPFVCASRGL